MAQAEAEQSKNLAMIRGMEAYKNGLSAYGSIGEAARQEAEKQISIMQGQVAGYDEIIKEAEAKIKEVTNSALNATGTSGSYETSKSSGASTKPGGSGAKDFSTPEWTLGTGKLRKLREKPIPNTSTMPCIF